MRGTILKVHTATGDVFWQVPASGDVVTKGSQAAAEYKLSERRLHYPFAATGNKPGRQMLAPWSVSRTGHTM